MYILYTYKNIIINQGNVQVIYNNYITTLYTIGRYSISISVETSHKNMKYYNIDSILLLLACNGVIGNSSFDW